MKSKESPNLYEILRTASRQSVETAAPEPHHAPPDEPHEPALQERLAIYKASKLGLAPSAPAAADAAATAAPPPPATPPASAGPLTAAALSAQPAAPAKGPGERVLRLTYNTVAFLTLVGIGLLFVAYSLGVRAGRSGTPTAPAVEASVPEVPRPPAATPPRPAPAPAPAPAPRIFAIRVAEWPYRTAQERVKANMAAEDARKTLARAGLAGAEAVPLTRGKDPRLALYLGRYADTGSGTSRSGLAAVQKLKVQNQTPFAQAQFEEIPR